MYLDYVRERLGVEYFEIPDRGFVSYRVQPDHLFIVDMYIKPEHRGTSVGLALINKMVEITKANGKSIVIAAVDLNTNGAEKSKAFIKWHGMKLIKEDGPYLYFMKEV